MQRLILAISISVLLVSCGDGGLTPGPEVEAPFEALNYDGSNQDAPEFEGTQDLAGAVMFPSNIISAFEGNKLAKVQYYIKEKPSSANIKIYSSTSNGGPGNLIYSASISGEIAADSWNEHELTNTVTLTRDDLWISIEFSHVNTQRTLGCDEGPAVSNGDWLLIDGQWEILSQFAPTVNINWNIRAVIDPS
ncbi:MAG: hypothetical protein MRZ79_12035 [Bacteroidia bacterium]|nr:hypothetical protein [Bacteroidia bacterium]